MSSLGQDTCRAVNGATEKVQFVCFQWYFFAKRNSLIEQCASLDFPDSDVAVREFFLGNLKSLHFCSRHGWQNNLSSTMVFSLNVLQHYAVSSVNRTLSLQCIQELIKVNKFRQLPEWTKSLRTSAMLWQCPQGLQLYEGTEVSRTPAILWQWPQGLHLS